MKLRLLGDRVILKYQEAKEKKMQENMELTEKGDRYG